MAGLIDGDRLNLFFVKDKELSQVANEVVEIGEVDSPNEFSSTPTTFDVVAEWVCNAKEVEVMVSWVTKTAPPVTLIPTAGDPTSGTRTCTRVLNTVDEDGFYTVYTPINIVGVSLESDGSSLSFQTRAGALRPDWYDLNQASIPLMGIRASDLLAGAGGILDFWCGYNEQWYHKHETIKTTQNASLSVQSVTLSKSQIVFTQESTTSTRTLTYTITDTFY